MRRLVATELSLAPRGSRLFIISDGSFLVSPEAAQIADEKDVAVELVVIGNPAVVAPLTGSEKFKMEIAQGNFTPERLDEICLFGL